MERYRTVQHVGRGSFGHAYLMVDQVTGEEVIMKIIDPKYLQEDKMKNDAMNEVRILQSVRHEFIIAFREFFIHPSASQGGNCMCIVTDYANVGDLHKRLDAQRHFLPGALLEEPVVLRWFAQICTALRYLHSRHILHRDLKTQNVFLTMPLQTPPVDPRAPPRLLQQQCPPFNLFPPNPEVDRRARVKLGDFGISKVLNNARDVANTMIGTPLYMSPEVVNHKPYSFKSDIWALGCLLFELLTLRPPFNGHSHTEVVRNILSGQVPHISRRYSQELRQLVREMLQKDPGRRPSISDILERPLIRPVAARYAEAERQREAALSVHQQRERPQPRGGSVPPPHRQVTASLAAEEAHRQVTASLAAEEAGRAPVSARSPSPCAPLRLPSRAVSSLPSHQKGSSREDAQPPKGPPSRDEAPKQSPPPQTANASGSASAASRERDRRRGPTVSVSSAFRERERDARHVSQGTGAPPVPEQPSVPFHKPPPVSSHSPAQVTAAGGSLSARDAQGREAPSSSSVCARLAAGYSINRLTHLEAARQKAGAVLSHRPLPQSHNQPQRVHNRWRQGGERGGDVTPAPAPVRAAVVSSGRDARGRPNGRQASAASKETGGGASQERRGDSSVPPAASCVQRGGLERGWHSARACGMSADASRAAFARLLRLEDLRRRKEVDREPPNELREPAAPPPPPGRLISRGSGAVCARSASASVSVPNRESSVAVGGGRRKGSAPAGVVGGGGGGEVQATNLTPPSPHGGKLLAVHSRAFRDRRAAELLGDCSSVRASVRSRQSAPRIRTASGGAGGLGALEMAAGSSHVQEEEEEAHAQRKGRTLTRGEGEEGLVEGGGVKVRDARGIVGGDCHERKGESDGVSKNRVHIQSSSSVASENEREESKVTLPCSSADPSLDLIKDEGGKKKGTLRGGAFSPPKRQKTEPRLLPSHRQKTEEEGASVSRRDGVKDRDPSSSSSSVYPPSRIQVSPADKETLKRPPLSPSVLVEQLDRRTPNKVTPQLPQKTPADPFSAHPNSPMLHSTPENPSQPTRSRSPKGISRADPKEPPPPPTTGSLLQPKRDSPPPLTMPPPLNVITPRSPPQSTHENANLKKDTPHRRSAIPTPPPPPSIERGPSPRSNTPAHVPPPSPPTPPQSALMVIPQTPSDRRGKPDGAPLSGRAHVLKESPPQTENILKDTDRLLYTPVRTAKAAHSGKSPVDTGGARSRSHTPQHVAGALPFPLQTRPSPCSQPIPTTKQIPEAPPDSLRNIEEAEKEKELRRSRSVCLPGHIAVSSHVRQAGKASASASTAAVAAQRRRSSGDILYPGRARESPRGDVSRQRHPFSCSSRQGGVEAAELPEPPPPVCLSAQAVQDLRERQLIASELKRRMREGDSVVWGGVAPIEGVVGVGEQLLSKDCGMRGEDLSTPTPGLEGECIQESANVSSRKGDLEREVDPSRGFSGKEEECSFSKAPLALVEGGRGREREEKWRLREGEKKEGRGGSVGSERRADRDRGQGGQSPKHRELMDRRLALEELRKEYKMETRRLKEELKRKLMIERERERREEEEEEGREDKKEGQVSFFPREHTHREGRKEKSPAALLPDPPRRLPVFSQISSGHTRPSPSSFQPPPRPSPFSREDEKGGRPDRTERRSQPQKKTNPTANEQRSQQKPNFKGSPPCSSRLVRPLQKEVCHSSQPSSPETKGLSPPSSRVQKGVAAVPKLEIERAVAAASRLCLMSSSRSSTRSPNAQAQGGATGRSGAASATSCSPRPPLPPRPSSSRMETGGLEDKQRERLSAEVGCPVSAASPVVSANESSQQRRAPGIGVSSSALSLVPMVSLTQKEREKEGGGERGAEGSLRAVTPRGVVVKIDPAAFVLSRQASPSVGGPSSSARGDRAQSPLLFTPNPMQASPVPSLEKIVNPGGGVERDRGAGGQIGVGAKERTEKADREECLAYVIRSPGVIRTRRGGGESEVQPENQNRAGSIRERGSAERDREAEGRGVRAKWAGKAEDGGSSALSFEGGGAEGRRGNTMTAKFAYPSFHSGISRERSTQKQKQEESEKAPQKQPCVLSFVKQEERIQKTSTLPLRVHPPRTPRVSPRHDDAERVSVSLSLSASPSSPPDNPPQPGERETAAAGNRSSKLSISVDNRPVHRPPPSSAPSHSVEEDKQKVPKTSNAVSHSEIPPGSPNFPHCLQKSSPSLATLQEDVEKKKAAQEKNSAISAILAPAHHHFALPVRGGRERERGITTHRERTTTAAGGDEERGHASSSVPLPCPPQPFQLAPHAPPNRERDRNGVREFSPSKRDLHGKRETALPLASPPKLPVLPSLSRHPSAKPPHGPLPVQSALSSSPPEPSHSAEDQRTAVSFPPHDASSSSCGDQGCTLSTSCALPLPLQRTQTTQSGGGMTGGLSTGVGVRILNGMSGPQSSSFPASSLTQLGDSYGGVSRSAFADFQSRVFDPQLGRQGDGEGEGAAGLGDTLALSVSVDEGEAGEGGEDMEGEEGPREVGTLRSPPLPPRCQQREEGCSWGSRRGRMEGGWGNVSAEGRSVDNVGGVGGEAGECIRASSKVSVQQGVCNSAAVRSRPVWLLPGPGGASLPSPSSGWAGGERGNSVEFQNYLGGLQHVNNLVGERGSVGESGSRGFSQSVSRKQERSHDFQKEMELAQSMGGFAEGRGSTGVFPNEPRPKANMSKQNLSLDLPSSSSSSSSFPSGPSPFPSAVGGAEAMRKEREVVGFQIDALQRFLQQSMGKSRFLRVHGVLKHCVDRGEEERERVVVSLQAESEDLHRESEHLYMVQLLLGLENKRREMGNQDK